MDIAGDSAEAINRWLAVLDSAGKSRLTIAAYRRALAHFASWSETSYGQPFDPARVIARDVRDWKSFQLTVEKAAPASINQRLTAVSHFFDWAEAQKLVRSHPARTIKGVPVEGRQPKALSTKELRRLLRAVHAGGDPLDIAMVEMLAGTGLRVSELLALQIEDLTIQPRSGAVIVRKGKHDRQRTVPLTSSVRIAVQSYLLTHPKRSEPKARLWWGERGPLRDRKAVTRILAKYAGSTNIK
jgi:site-specific recombinase XerD